MFIWRIKTEQSRAEQSRAEQSRAEQSTHSLLFCLFTANPGLFVAHVPVILNGDRDSSYRILELRGELLTSSLQFDPEALQLLPVPLATSVTADFYIIARGYRK